MLFEPYFRSQQFFPSTRIFQFCLRCSSHPSFPRSIFLDGFYSVGRIISGCCNRPRFVVAVNYFFFFEEKMGLFWDYSQFHLWDISGWIKLWLVIWSELRPARILVLRDFLGLFFASLFERAYFLHFLKFSVDWAVFSKIVVSLGGCGAAAIDDKHYQFIWFKQNSGLLTS